MFSKLNFLTIVIVFLSELPQRVSAEDMMDPEWFACSSTADCDLFIYNVLIDAVAANKRHIKDVGRVICQTQVCAWTASSARHITFQRCANMANV